MQAATPINDLCKTAQVVDMVAAMKEAGIYSQNTLAVDICSVMRRMAMALDTNLPSATDTALSQIKTILARPGVNRDKVMEGLGRVV